MAVNRPIKWLATLLMLLAISGSGWICYRTWPRKLPHTTGSKFPEIFFEDGRLGIALPTDALVAEVGDYNNALNTYLYLNLLRSRKSVDSTRAMVCAREGGGPGGYELFLQVKNNVLTSLPYLNSLIVHAAIPHFVLHSWTNQDLNRCKEQDVRFEAAFRLPVFTRFQQIPDAQLIGPMADFLVFKSSTDARVLARRDPTPPVLNLSQARELAEDMIVVARFYSLPLDYFLGIGAVENNYMGVIGDLDHAVWKRRAQRGDIVLRRRGRRVLVRNYSLGVWQITRETLRYAQKLYIQDRQNRDYSALPERLRPEVSSDPDAIKPETLTTFSGLLLRNLLDRFDGNVMQAVGAYNGGVQKPNLGYAQSVRVVAIYARNAISHAVALESPANEQ
jgi:hypothetical protein